MTNGDKLKEEIQKMNNNELAFILTYTACSYCSYKEEENCNDKNCKDGIKKYLESRCKP